MSDLTGYTVDRLQEMTLEQTELLTIGAIRNSKPEKKSGGLPPEKL